MALLPKDQVDLATLTPHGGESLLLDRILHHDADSTIARVVVGSRSGLLRDDGSVPAWLVVEYMAQAIAVHEGFAARDEGRSLELGFLVTVVGLEFASAELTPGDVLEIHTRRTRGRPGLGVVSHHCTAHREGSVDPRDPIATGRLSIAIRSMQTGKPVEAILGATAEPSRTKK